jgi:hypothetical protein
MSQRDKTLWIAGDSYGTFDKTSDIHWAKELAMYHKCDRIFNLSRGGFDQSAINFTAESILTNHMWPGRQEDELFLFDQDLLLIFCTTADRFCHLKNPFKKVDPEIGIANLNWHTPYLENQEPMPWIEHMPEDSNLYSQTYNSLITDEHILDNLDLTEDDLSYIKESFSIHDDHWQNIKNSQQLSGIIHYFESQSTGAKLSTLNNNFYMPHVGGYKLPNVGDLIGDTPDIPGETLVNHLTPQQHFDYFDKVVKYI